MKHWLGVSFIDYPDGSLSNDKAPETPSDEQCAMPLSVP
jgi:hypothetical protein